MSHITHKQDDYIKGRSRGDSDAYDILATDRKEGGFSSSTGVVGGSDISRRARSPGPDRRTPSPTGGTSYGGKPPGGSWEELRGDDFDIKQCGISTQNNHQ
jgi:hypothetical protein